MKGEDDLFWPGMADLVIVLFAVRLILFVFKIKLFIDREIHLKTYASSYAKINELEQALHRLKNSEYFGYQEENSRYEVEVPVFYDQWQSEIQPEYRKKLIKEGKQLQGLLLQVDRQSVENEPDVKYLVIVEGMAAKDPKNNTRNEDPSLSGMLPCLGIAGHWHW